MHSALRRYSKPHTQMFFVYCFLFLFLLGFLVCECEQGGCLKETLVFIKDIGGVELWESNKFRNIQFNMGRFEDYRFVNLVRTSALGSLYNGVHVVANSKESESKSVHLFVPNSTCLDVPRTVVLHQAMCIEDQPGPSRALTPILDIIADPESNENKETVILVFPMMGVENLQSFSSLDRFRDWNEASVKYYLYRMLKSVKFAHDRKFLVANLHPESFLVSPDTGGLLLFDLSKAVNIRRNDDDAFSVSISPGGINPCYCAPELLLGLPVYNTRVDSWAYGVLFAEAVLGRAPLFEGCDKVGGNAALQLKAIARVIGVKKLRQYQIDLNFSFPVGFDWRQMPMLRARLSLDRNGRGVGKDVVDMITHLLQWNPQDRRDLKSAGSHSYFREVLAAARGGGS